MKLWILCWGIAFGTGCFWHYLYDWLPGPLTALLAPVNESVWEHLKLLVIPYYVGCLPLLKASPGPARLLGSVCAGNLLMVPVLLAGFYVPLGAFSISNLFWHITLYGITLAVGLYCQRRWLLWPGGQKHDGLVIALAVSWWAILCVYTVFPGQAPIFQSP